MEASINLIGISGRKQSGKDTVAKIIRNLTTPKERKYLGDGLYSREIQFSPWQIKKFGSPLKQVLSILTGIPVEDFEREEIKSLTIKQCIEKGIINKDFLCTNL